MSSEWNRILQERMRQQQLYQHKMGEKTVIQDEIIKRKKDEGGYRTDDAMIEGDLGICPGIGKMCIGIDFCVSPSI